MRDYTVYFIVKNDGHGYLNQAEVSANNQKEAVASVKKSVRENSGKCAFCATCKVPERVKGGMLFNGMIYTRYSELFNRLW